MKANITIRQFCFPEDYPAVLALWQTAGPGIHTGRSDTEAEIAKKVQRDPDLFLIAVEDEQVVGAVMGGYDGRRGMVYHLAVAPSHRRHGLGLALMEELEQRLRARGCVKSYLLVVPDNEDAIQFYEAHGWERMPLYIYGKELL